MINKDGGTTIFQFYGGDTAVMRGGHRAHGGIPQSPPLGKTLPPQVTPRVLHSTAAPGPGFILDDLPRGPGFCISIKLCLVQ